MRINIETRIMEEQKKQEEKKVEKKLEKEVRMLLQVHDELVFEIANERVEKIVPNLKDIMEHVLTEETSKGIPVLVEVKLGQNWEEMEKMKF